MSVLLDCYESTDPRKYPLLEPDVVLFNVCNKDLPYSVVSKYLQRHLETAINSYSMYNR